jgi:sulfopyruvate decarboxylase subunit alpha
MFSGSEMVALLTEMGITDVVWVPDSTFGAWEAALVESPHIRLVRVCREGEAWAVAAGLYLGGRTPLVMIQCTGLFESGDALRNVVHDYQLPLFAFIGYRSYHSDSTLPGDTARRFAEPILRTWEIDYRLIETAAERDAIISHFAECREKGRPGAALIAEGRA